MSLTVRQHPVRNTTLWALAELHPIQVSAPLPVSGHMFLLFLSVKSHLQQPLLVVYRSLSSSDTFLLMFACFLAP